MSLAEISLLSWNLSVNVTGGSAHLSWSDFPLGVSIESFSVKYTDVDTGVSIYRRMEHGHQRTYYLERGVRPDREFEFQIIATAKNATYSSVKVSKTTPEGGKNQRTKPCQNTRLLIMWSDIILICCNSVKYLLDNRVQSHKECL